MSLGVYVVCKDEENLITPCVTPLLKVFPQVEVIDLGSKDSTLDKLASLGCKVHNRPCNAEEYPHLKNEFANKHEWVFWVDGDEIYPEENLHLVTKFIDSKNHHAYRMTWKNLALKKGQIQISTPIIGGTKLYRPIRYFYRRAWPREVLDSPKGVNGLGRQQGPTLNGLWCWHGKFLKRSRIVDFDREQKRQLYRMGLDPNGNPVEFHSTPGWEKETLKDFPWPSPELALWEE
jgi:hypothetical protein